ncbi:hypothetical protein J7E97_16485 [Streptomyces sp. ISL-66]|uniref:hypothetical protein n=1 Tax=Streptomyces sp. ISL-66 TaxID=2819186 RepID=UPI001BEC236E|nr:hypothetical protein [Streptomyces sp. ISL-66]MBT2469428.1 hypothetical protein [Streptomyces sp. ISL-66]
MPPQLTQQKHFGVEDRDQLLSGLAVAQCAHSGEPDLLRQRPGSDHWRCAVLPVAQFLQVRQGTSRKAGRVTHGLCHLVQPLLLVLAALLFAHDHTR